MYVWLPATVTRQNNNLCLKHTQNIEMTDLCLAYHCKIGNVGRGRMFFREREREGVKRVKL